MGRFEGSVALVTGGGSGIGAAVARALAAEGAVVRVADVDATAARSVAEEISGSAVVLDVSDGDAWQAARRAGDLDGVDVALLAAGVVGPRGVADADPVELARVVQIDLLGVVHGTAALASAMRARGGGGRVVAVSSAAGLFPMPLAPGYGAAKWGVVGWVLSAAPVLAGDGIVLSALCPAWTDTPFLSSDDRALLEAMGAGVMPVSDVVAQALRLMAEGEAGEVVHVDAEHGAARVSVQPRFARVEPREP